MAFLNALVTQQFAPDALPAAARSAIGKPLRRAAALTQLALVGACASLPEAQREHPTLLLWQSISGPRQETQNLLDEVCLGGGEPMPYDFLATQPALAAAQIQPFLPGLRSATHLPLDNESASHWAMILGLACTWLDQGRCAQVLCAQLDHWSDSASGQWLTVTDRPLETSFASLQIASEDATAASLDNANFPAALREWLQGCQTSHLILQSAALPRLAVEFARL